MIGGHSHEHSHHRQVQAASSKNLESGHHAARNITFAFVINLVFAVIELIGGWWTNSVAIQADAIHDFGDSMVLLAALALQVASGAEARGRFTFGFRRLSLLSAFSTSVVLFLGSLFILVTAVDRLLQPQMPHLDGMLWLAILGVVVNGVAAWKIGHGHTHNERALSWHMVEDLLGWVAVLIGSIIMRFVHLPWLDPAMSLVIAGFIILGATRNIWSSSQLFLQAAPVLDFESMKSEVAGINGARHVSALKVWSLDGFHHVASVHVTIDSSLDAKVRDGIKDQIKKILSQHGEFDVTIQLDEV